MSKLLIADKWKLVRRTNVPRHLRHLLLLVMHYQNDKSSAWCKRETLADELGITRDVVSQQMKELETIGVLERVWKSRNSRPSREYAIQFSELAKHQRTLRGSSTCTLSESSDCDAPTLSDSSTSVLGIPQGQSEASLRHEVTSEEPYEEPSSCPNRFTDSDVETSGFILNLILEMQPDRRRPNLDKWADTIRLMRERDKRTDAQIRELFTWCNRDPFWRTNILSPDKLRQKWDDLQLRRGESVRATTDSVTSTDANQIFDRASSYLHEYDQHKPLDMAELRNRFGESAELVKKFRMRIQGMDQFTKTDVRRSFTAELGQLEAV